MCLPEYMKNSPQLTIGLLYSNGMFKPLLRISKIIPIQASCSPSAQMQKISDACPLSSEDPLGVKLKQGWPMLFKLRPDRKTKERGI